MCFSVYLIISENTIQSVHNSFERLEYEISNYIHEKCTDLIVLFSKLYFSYLPAVSGDEQSHLTMQRDMRQDSSTMRDSALLPGSQEL